MLRNRVGLIEKLYLLLCRVKRSAGLRKARDMEELIYKKYGKRIYNEVIHQIWKRGY